MKQNHLHSKYMHGKHERESVDCYNNVMDYLNNDGGCPKPTDEDRKSDVNQHQDKELFIGEADTIVNPWAMMIHIQYTPLANGAMMCPFRLYGVTVLAKLVSECLLCGSVRGILKNDRVVMSKGDCCVFVPS